MARAKQNPKDGVRRSQLLTMLGPGSMVDLPRRSVLMAGLDHWIGMHDAVELDEPRLFTVMLRMTGESLRLKVPPTPKDEEDLKGVVAFQFPEWFVAQDPDARELQSGRRSRRLLMRGQYEALKPSQKKRHVPMRFVAACRNGHLQDVEWNKVVHQDAPPCTPVELALVELGVAGDLADLSVRCLRCGKAVVLSQLVARGRESEAADGGDKNPLGTCRGLRPWLGNEAAASETCIDSESESPRPCRLRLLVRHASNAYFPTTARVISIPAPDGGGGDVVARVAQLPETTRNKVLRWGLAKLAEKREDNREDFETVADIDDAALYAAIEKLQGGLVLTAPEAVWKHPKDEELAAFFAVGESHQRKITDKNFTAYAFPLTRLPDATAEVAGKTIHVRDFIERVVLVERLREVQTLLGFTRIESPPELIRSEYDLNPRMARITLNERWRPAVEIRGEGVFVALDAKKVEAWLEREEVAEHVARVREQLLESRYGKKVSGDLTSERIERTELPYILVHTIAHLVLTAIALECGYSTSAIRERIYVPGLGGGGEVDGVRRYGFLVYTGTTDSEGTMGGLVEVGRAITRHLAAALELGALCSNDPICSEATHPMAVGGHIHGAACHGCVLMPESSCEKRNELLDRRLVLETVGGNAALAFFGPTRAGAGT